MTDFEKNTDNSGDDPAAKTLGLGSSEKRNLKLHKTRHWRKQELDAESIDLSKSSQEYDPDFQEAEEVVLYHPETEEEADFYQALTGAKMSQDVSEVEAQYPEDETGGLPSNGIVNPSIRVILGEEDVREDVDQIMGRHGYTSELNQL